MSEITKMLNEEYERTLSDLSLETKETEEAKWELQKLTALHKQRMDIAEQEARKAKDENDVKEGKKDRIVKIALESAGILIPVAASSYWMAKGLMFEKTGSYSSRTMQWLSSHFRLFKK